MVSFYFHNLFVYSCCLHLWLGYCHGLNSFVNGSGIANSVSGRMSLFTVYLEDLYHNPSPIEAQWLYVQIFSKNDTSIVRPVIFPLRTPNGKHAGVFFVLLSCSYLALLTLYQKYARNSTRSSFF